jgi:cyclin D5
MAAVTPFDYLPCFSSRLDRHGGGGDDGHDPARVALKSIGFIFATAEGSFIFLYFHTHHNQIFSCILSD